MALAGQLSLIYACSMKNPTTTALLNIIPGLGYIYLGEKRRIFGAALLTGFCFTVVASFDPLLLPEEYTSSPFRVWDWFDLASLAAYTAAFMYDGYTSTKEHNSHVLKISD